MAMDHSRCSAMRALNIGIKLVGHNSAKPAAFPLRSPWAGGV